MNRIYKLLKIYLWIFIFTFCILIWFEPIEVVAMTALILLFINMVPAYLVTSIGTDFLYRRNQRYRAYRKDGGHPFWDNL